MAEKHRFSKQCVYTLRKRDNLEFIYRSSGTGTFRENKKGYSKISFAIRKTRAWNEETNRQSREMKRQADIYVFCLLKHTVQETIEPLDVAQWEYYVLPTSVLDDKMGDQKQISLQAVKKLDPLQVPYEDLSSCIGHLAVEIDLNRNRGSK